jgi:hypothetical protein
MTLRAALASLTLTLASAAIAAASPALASAVTHPSYAVDLTLDYFSAAELPPDPIFQGSFLTGNIQFWYQLISSDPGAAGAPLVPTGPQHDIGVVGVGDSVSIHFSPPDPCFRAGSCNLFFSFGGDAAGFPAVAESPGPPTDGAPDVLPAVQFGVFNTDGKPISSSGPIFAFDAPVQVGDWQTDVSLTGVPEPASWGLLLLGFTIVGRTPAPQAGAGAGLKRGILSES